MAGLTLNTDGSYSFNAGDAAYQHLAQGATSDVVANYTVSDEHGGYQYQPRLTITLTGTNDAPVAVADTNSRRRGHDRSPARWRPTTATSTTAPA